MRSPGGSTARACPAHSPKSSEISLSTSVSGVKAEPSPSREASPVGAASSPQVEGRLSSQAASSTALLVTMWVPGSRRALGTKPGMSTDKFPVRESGQPASRRPDPNLVQS